MKGKVKVKLFSGVRLLSDPKDCSLPGSSVHGILQATVLEWGAIAFSSYCTSYTEYFGPVYFAFQRGIRRQTTHLKEEMFYRDALRNQEQESPL